jgi:hypothetical protein
VAVRVVTGPDQGDADVVIVAAVLHESGIVIDVISVGWFPDSGAGVAAPFTLTDDLGTEYEDGGRSWSDGSRTVGDFSVPRGSYQFKTAVPGAARFLRVQFPNRSVVLTL